MAHGTVARAPGLRVGYVPQRLAVDRSMPMTVRRFLSLPRRVSDGVAADVLARVGVGAVQERQMAALSGGQFQRVLLARALLSDPQLLILDEPTQGLDQPGEAAFYQLIEALRADTGAAVLMVSHDLAVIDHMCDRVLVMQHGRAVEELSREALATAQMQTDYARSLFAASADRMLEG